MDRYAAIGDPGQSTDAPFSPLTAGAIETLESLPTGNANVVVQILSVRPKVDPGFGTLYYLVLSDGVHFRLAVLLRANGVVEACTSLRYTIVALDRITWIVLRNSTDTLTLLEHPIAPQCSLALTLRLFPCLAPRYLATHSPAAQVSIIIPRQGQF
ncbi:hypothetical protein FB451DRAFT_1554151 [Mycena latifolia]|nr:hypothetical protein FB451DRAFT_1554151 [Mycena latifolia]